MWGFGLWVCSSACVEPPSAQRVCEDEGLEALCTIDGMESVSRCCEVLEPIVRTQSDRLSDVQQAFISQCARQFTLQDTEIECVALLKHIALEDGWSTGKVVERCAALHGNIADDSTREREFMLGCVEALTRTVFVADYAHDPLALTYFCERDGSTQLNTYTRECIDTLSAYDWFPGTSIASQESVSGTRWKSVESVPDVCRVMGGPPTCQERSLGSGTIICAEALQALSFPNEPDAFSLVAQLDTEQVLARSCLVIASNGSMYADYGPGGTCLQTTNTVGVMECAHD